jgi:hypothetical protein
VARRVATVPDDPAPAAWRLPAAVAVGVPTAVFAAHALLYGRWIVDDAGITFAYVRSVATGAGPVLLQRADLVRAVRAAALSLVVFALAAPDIGGAALTSNLRLVDMVGLADRQIAGFWAAGDIAGLRAHLLRDVRPTFLTLNSDWARLTGLPADPRLAADYDKIATSPAGVTDWVRREALGPGDLDALRIRAAQAAVADEDARRSPRASCGDVLVPSDR